MGKQGKHLQHEKGGTMSDEDEYEVGYGKPPKDTQFRKGQSGNPKGRPKKELSLPEMVRKAFLARVRVKGENGEHYHMSKAEAAITQVANAAAKGDRKAFNQLLQLLKNFPLVSQTPLV